MFIAIPVNAGNDTSGNPRRGWKIVDAETGSFSTFVDEGYEGWQAVYKAGFLRDEIVQACVRHFKITATEYKSLVKTWV